MIELSKDLPENELDNFIRDFDLSRLGLKSLFKFNNSDSVIKAGWKVGLNNSYMLMLLKPMEKGFDLKDLLTEKIHFNKFFTDEETANTSSVRYGYNNFKNKNPFRVEDSIVLFFLKGNTKARRVFLAANFTNWQNGAIPMTLTDSGWITYVKIGTGKYWYKFIVDGEWTTDNDNKINENDGEGNINSVYYKTNHTFRLNGFEKARKVYISGSFNDWREKELLMKKTATGWELPVMLPEGTHTYKFIVDGDWYEDPINPDKLPNQFGGHNSVIRFGATHIFKLDGYTNAKKVMLVGSFNAWQDYELQMVKTATGWELPYVIGQGNYEYKFIVDGKSIADPASIAKGNNGNSFLVIAPNYTFRLYAPEAKKVMLAGDFNGWNPNSIPMQKGEDGVWIFQLNLLAGKHRYKFIVDGNWILDPKNKLWEENEYGTGNSIVWLGQQNKDR